MSTSIVVSRPTLTHRHRRAIIASLLSHLAAWQSMSGRIAVLESLAGVLDSSVLRGVLPLLTPLLSAKSEEYRWLLQESAQEQSRYLALLIGIINKQSAQVLADTDAEAWKFVLKAVAADGSGSGGLLPLVRKNDC